MSGIFAGLPHVAYARTGDCVDLYSAMADVVTRTAWSPHAVRLLMLIGNTPACEQGHKDNQSGHSADSLRSLLTENKITLVAVQLSHEADANSLVKQQQQFVRLAANPGSDAIPYYFISGAESVMYAATLEKCWDP